MADPFATPIPQHILVPALRVLAQRRTTLGPGGGKPSLQNQYLRQQALARRRPNSGVVRKPNWQDDNRVARKPGEY